MFVAGAVTGMTVYATWMTPTSRVVYVDRPAHTGADVAAGPTPVASIASATPADSRIAKEEASLAPSIARPLAPVSVAHKSPRSTSSRTSTLDAERRLLDDARASLIQGNPDRALSCLENYRKRYPQGILAEEADTMRVEALAGVGRPDDARRAAEEFSLRAPSIYAPTVESAISTSP
jgi:hypothetical protein